MQRGTPAAALNHRISITTHHVPDHSVIRAGWRMKHVHECGGGLDLMGPCAVCSTCVGKSARHPQLSCRSLHLLGMVIETFHKCQAIEGRSRLVGTAWPT